MASSEKKLTPLAKFHEFCTRGVDDEVAAAIKGDSSLATKPGELGNTGLHWASSGGHSKVVKVLLDSKADVNSQNKVKDTPLHMAAWRDRVDVIKILVEAGADKTAKNQDGRFSCESSSSKDISRSM